MNKRTLQRMVAELRQLRNQLNRLNDFTGTDVYLALPLQERVLINEQLNAMKWYYSSLKNRVWYYRGKEVTGDGRSFTEDPVK